MSALDQAVLDRAGGAGGVSVTGGRTWQRLRRDPVAMVALVYLVFIVVVAVFAPAIAPRSPTRQDFTALFSGPSRAHWLGTDGNGHDTFSRLVFGARASMRVGGQVVLTALAIAIPVGLFSGYRGGRADLVIMRVTDALLSFPPIILALAVAGALGPGLNNTALALTVVVVPSFVRLIRGQVLALSQEPFVDASRAIGTGTGGILFRRVLPNVASPLVVATSLALAAITVAEAGLSFVGLGQQPPNPSWGSMLRVAFTEVYNHPGQLAGPAIVIALTVLAFNAFGDGLRDALTGDVDVTGPDAAAASSPTLGITAVSTRSHPVVGTEARARRGDVLLEVDGLTVEFDGAGGPVTVVDDVSLTIAEGEVLGLVGESGCGKTVTSLSILRLVPSPPGRVTGGEIRFAGRDLLTLGFRELREIRGGEIAMVFQDPMASLNPAFTVGNQLVEAQRLHRSVSRRAARVRAEELLTRVGIPDPGRRLDEHPHQFSGGMRQRVMIALALANEPRLLIADEPTTALDVTVQAEILDLLRSLQRELGMAVLFVTHDLGVVADFCHRLAVMYAGQIVETGRVDDVFDAPGHPYTEGLLASVPEPGADRRLVAIPGVVPSPGTFPIGCRFAPRCGYADDRCRTDPVALDGGARCVRRHELHLQGAR